MYFPYFRGRQYELLALKELASQKLISKSVIPVIEPIKQIPALKNALKAFNDAGLPIGIIVNPNVGGLIGKSDEICSVLTTYQSTAFPGILINSDAQLALERLSALAYLPTQFITEFIKSNGYAGVAYTSTMRTEGINVAVFDESIFECVAVHTVEINNISYSYEKITYGQQK